MKNISHIFTLLVAVFIADLVCSVLLIKIYSNRISDAFMSYSISEARRLVTLVVNKSVSYQVNRGMNAGDMVKVIRNSDNEIEMIDFDSSTVNQTLTSIVGFIEDNLTLISNGDMSLVSIDLNGVSENDYEILKKGLIFYVAMGSFTKSSLLSNVGPVIPVKLSISGDVVGKLDADIQEYGINNALIKIFFKLDVNTMVTAPFVSEVTVVSVDVPVSLKVIQGSIPDYYLSGIQGSSGSIKN